MASVRLASFNKDWHGQVIKLSQSTGFAANGSCVPLWISHSHAGLLSFGQNLDTCMCVCVCDLDLILDKVFKLLSIFFCQIAAKNVSTWPNSFNVKLMHAGFIWHRSIVPGRWGIACFQASSSWVKSTDLRSVLFFAHFFVHLIPVPTSSGATEP